MLLHCIFKIQGWFCLPYHVTDNRMKPILGIDHGDARIGIAISDDLQMLAHPYETIAQRDGNPLDRIVQIVIERGVERIIIGLPRNMNGSYGPAAEKVKAFADQLQARISIPIESWDERLTTVMASRSLHEAGHNTRKQKAVIDQVAAQVLLQSWLDANAMR